MEGFRLSRSEYGNWYFTTKYQVAKFLKYKNYINFYQIQKYKEKKGKCVFNIRGWLFEPHVDISEIPQKYIDRDLEEIMNLNLKAYD